MILRSRRGEAVTLAVMGIMMVGGLIFWMFSGHSHMSGPASEVLSGERHGSARDGVEGHRGDEGDEVSGRDGMQAPGVDERNP